MSMIGDKALSIALYIVTVLVVAIDIHEFVTKGGVDPLYLLISAACVCATVVDITGRLKKKD